MQIQRNWWKRIIFGLLALVIMWLVGDFTYSRLVGYRLQRWEESVRWESDGVREGCRGYTIGSGQTAVLLVHGFNDCPRLYDGMAPLLAEQGFTVRVMRLPGFAERMASARKVTRVQWIRSVQQELKLLRRDHDRVTVVAHSLGAAITIRCLTEQPRAADRVALIAPAVKISSRRSPVLEAGTWQEIGKRLLCFTTVTESAFPPDVHDPEAREYPWSSPFVACSVTDELFMLLDENRGSGSRFRTPLMMVLSRDDQVADWREAERFYREAASLEKELRYMEDAGHAIPIDYGWRDLTMEIASFLKTDP